ncbi:C25 family cysteine peptidase [Chitinophagales bacterium]|nr:C25 family cysteine peptidase [Chitinophagales bacterium]
MRKLLSLLFLLTIGASQLLTAQTYGNEWIDYDRTHYKFQTEEEGLHRIDYSTLVAAGIDLNAEDFKVYNNGKQVPIYVSTTGVVGPGDYIEFYAKENDGEYDTKLYQVADWQLHTDFSLFTAKRSFFLVSDPDGTHLRFAEEVNNLTNLPPAEEYFMYKARKTKSNAFHFGEPFFLQGIFNFFTTFDKGEGWLSGLIKATDNSDGTTTYIDLTNAVSTPSIATNAPEIARVENRICGRTRSLGVINDQEIGISVNGIEYTHESFSKFDVKTYSFDLPLDQLGTTSNSTGATTTARYRAFNGSTAGFPYKSKYSVAYTEIEYPRLFEFGNEEYFIFTIDVTEDKYIEIADFNGGSAPVVYDMSSRKRFEPVFEGGVYKLKLDFINSNTIGTKRTFFISNTASSSLVNVTSLEARDFVKYSAVANQGSYIMLYNELLKQGAVDQIDRYSDYRQSIAGGSHDVIQVSIDELYDQFSAGIEKHPMAIKNFVNYAVDNWAVNPEFLYLVGKSVLYSKTRTSATWFEQGLVPSYGYYASDLMLVSQTVSDYWPRLPFGRLPANNALEVEKYLDKVITYESWFDLTDCDEIKDRAWMKNTLHVSKGWGQDQTDGFTDDLNGYEEQVEGSSLGYNVIDLFEDTWGATPSGQTDWYGPEPPQMVPYWEEGISFLNFVGHASGNYWQYPISKDPETDYANEGKYPFILSNSCFVGQIHEAGGNSMAEDYIHSCNSGAIVFVAAVALSSPSFLQIYSSEFLTVMSGPLYGKSISEGLQQTIQNIYDPVDPGIRVVCNEFTYTGDPAIEMYNWDQPEYLIELGDVSVSPSGPIDPLQTSEMTVSVDLTNYGRAVNEALSICIEQIDPSSGEVIFSETFQVENPGFEGSFEFDIDVPQGETAGTDNLVITIDCNNQWAEDCEDNNILSIPITLLDSDCEDLGLSIAGLSSSYCVNDPDVSLQLTSSTGANISGEQFSVNGSSMDELDFQDLGPGTYSVSYQYEDPNMEACSYDGSQQVIIYDVPNSFFTVSDDEICLNGNEEITVTYSGLFDASYDYNWNFGPGAQTTQINEVTFLVSYSNDGDKEITLQVSTPQGCDSEEFEIELEAGDPLEDPDVVCSDQTSNSVEFEWEAIPGATSYVYQVNGGNFQPLPVNVTSIEIEDLSAGEVITFEFQAISNGPCQLSTISSATCQVSDCPVQELGLELESLTVCEDATPLAISVDIAGGDLDGPGVSNSQMEFDPSDVGEGEYEIVYAFTTADNCEYFESVTVNVYEAADADIDGGLDFCFGGSTTLEADGNFQSVLWEPGNSDELELEVTEPGVYSLTVFTSEGCSDSRTVTVVENPELNLGLESNNDGMEFCFGDSDYEFELNFAGGELTGIGIESDGEFDPGLAGLGTHIINYSYQDPQTGCTWNESIELTVNQEATAEIVGELQFCEGDGTTLTAESGFDSYLWLPGGFMGEELDVDQAGIYTLIVTTDKGCEDTREVLVEQNDLPELLIDATQISVCEGDEVTLTASVVGGSQGSFNWAAANDVIEVNQGVLIAAPTSDVEYEVSFTNAAGCSTTKSLAITIATDQNPEAAFSPTATEICIGDVITLENESVNAVDNFWTVTNSTTGTVLELETAIPVLTFDELGTYDVALNITGCGITEDSSTQLAAFTVVDLPEVNADANMEEVCEGNLVTLSVSGTNGTYTWTGPGLINSVGQEVTALITESAMYTVLTETGSGCTNSGTIFVESLALPSVEAEADVLTVCAGGTVELSAIGDAANYSWSGAGLEVSEGQTVTAVIEEQTEFTVTAISDGDCTTEDQIVISISETPGLSVESSTMLICESGQVELSAMSDQFGVEFNWEGAGLETTTGGTVTASITETTSFMVTAANQFECDRTETITVEVVDLPSISLEASSLSVCAGESVSLTAITGDGEFGFQWSGPNLDTGEGSAVSVQVDDDSEYMVTVTNQQNCSSSETITVTTVDAPELSLSATALTVCTGDEVTLLAETSLENPVYNWTGEGLESFEGAMITIPVTGEQEYSVTVDVNGLCVRTEEITLNSIDRPEFEVNANSTEACPGELVTLTVSGEGSDFSWSGPNLSATTGTTVDVTVNETADYVVTAEGTSGCNSSKGITIENLGDFAAFIDGDDTVCEGDDVVLEASGGASYNWLSTDLVGDPNADIITITPIETTTLELEVVGENGCSKLITFEVFVDTESVECEDEVEAKPPFDIPNAITPNNDGFNDTWVIDGLEEYPVHTIQVYNRWGQLLFESTSYSHDWSGTNDGVDLPHGTYYYVMDIPAHSAEMITGSLTILK